ncbi:MAG: hypothetical protein Q8K87_10030 [Hydrogenophaga sp.]|nr:hypothetical protein [Hydrogenophaga sp.]
MSSINKPERATQDRVIALFTQQLGYRYLGNWADRAGNHCVEEGLLPVHLARRGDRPRTAGAAPAALARWTETARAQAGLVPARNAPHTPW